MQILHIRKDKGNREKKGLVASWPPRPAPIAALDSVGRFESVQTTVVVLTKYYGATLPKKLEISRWARCYFWSRFLQGFPQYYSSLIGFPSVSSFLPVNFLVFLVVKHFFLPPGSLKHQSTWVSGHQMARSFSNATLLALLMTPLSHSNVSAAANNSSRFLWGTATAAYQVEGSRNADGRTPCK